MEVSVGLYCTDAIPQVVHSDISSMLEKQIKVI